MSQMSISIGLMIPANNTTLESEILGWLPAGSTCQTARIPRGAGLLTAQTLPAYTAKALDLASEFASADIDVVVYGCTAASFIAGPAGEASLSADLGRITGKPIATVARSMVSALKNMNAKKIALVTPYADTVNMGLKAFLSADGIDVGNFNSFYAADVQALGRISATDVLDLARRTMTPECDALFIACAQLPTAEILDELENEFKRPALSSNRAVSTQAIVASKQSTHRRANENV